MKYAILVIILVILAYMVIDFNARTAELNRLSTEEAIIQSQVTARVETKEYLQTQIAYATSEAALQEFAYNNHMAKPEDKVVVPFGVSAATPTPTPRPLPTTTQVSNLQLWWWQFFPPR